MGDLLLQRLAVARAAATQRQPTSRLLCACLREAILDGTLPAHTRLPPTRDLAGELGVSRNTVLYAYDQLAAEGCLVSRTGSGSFVADLSADRFIATPPAVGTRAPSPAPAPLPSGVSARGEALLGRVSATDVQWGAFLPGVPDVTEFPQQRFAQITAQCARRGPPALRSYATAGGHPALQRSLAQYLRQVRSVQCEPEQILITEGVHQAVDLLSRMLADAGDIAWVEDPGYWGTRNILRMNGLQVDAIAVDADGMQVVEPVPGREPKLAFVTPSHQYPLGPIMALSRRLALLEAARRHGFWVVEDDYDSEFRFAGQPIPSLQSLMPDAPVIYVGTFSKTLYPGLRTAYMVLPPALVDRIGAAQMELYRGGHLLTQAALAEFIDSGHYAAHIRRMRLIYGHRRAYLVELITQHLGAEWMHPFDSNAGLHLVMSLPDGLNDVLVSHRAREAGVLVRPLSRYYEAEVQRQGLLMGFAAVPIEAMQAPFQSLVSCIAGELREPDLSPVVGPVRATGPCRAA